MIHAEILETWYICIVVHRHIDPVAVIKADCKFEGNFDCPALKCHVGSAGTSRDAWKRMCMSVPTFFVRDI